MVRSRARLTSAGSTAYNQETLVIPLSAKPNHAAVLMATTIPCKIHIPFRLPRPLNPTKPPASKTARPANCELVDGRADPSTYPPLLSLKSAAATRPNLHSLNSWPAVQCNEGFCNASEGQRLPLTTTMASQKPHHFTNLFLIRKARAP